MIGTQSAIKQEIVQCQESTTDFETNFLLPTPSARKPTRFLFKKNNIEWDRVRYVGGIGHMFNVNNFRTCVAQRFFIALNRLTVLKKTMHRNIKVDKKANLFGAGRTLLRLFSL